MIWKIKFDLIAQEEKSSISAEFRARAQAFEPSRVEIEKGLHLKECVDEEDVENILE